MALRAAAGVLRGALAGVLNTSFGVTFGFFADCGAAFFAGVLRFGASSCTCGWHCVIEVFGIEMQCKIYPDEHDVFQSKGMRM